MVSIDLNCDMGEGMGNDALIMPYISSANIACGFHAGDDDTIQQTIELALKHDVAIGAHPSFNDRENFGRTPMNITQNELYDLVSIQLNKIIHIAKQFNTTLHHVKPHGALYNMAAKDAAMSNTIALAIKNINDKLVLYGLSNSLLISEAKAVGLVTASEVFADRTYTDDGSLTPRTQTNALIENEERSIHQVIQMILHKQVTSTAGKCIAIKADTVCIHGDGIHAVSFAQKINATLKEKNIVIKTI